MDREALQPNDRDDLFFTEVIDPTDTTTWAQNDVAAQVRDAINDPRLAIETMGEGPWPAAVTFTVGNRHVIVDYQAPGIGQIDRQSNLSDVLVHSPNVGGPHAPTPTFRFDQWHIDAEGHIRSQLDTLDPADIRSSSPVHDRSDAVQVVTAWARTELGYLDTGHQDTARTLHHAVELSPASAVQIHGTTAQLNGKTLHATDVQAGAPAATAQVSLRVTDDRTGKVVDQANASVGPDATDHVSRWIKSGGQRVSPSLGERLVEQARSAFELTKAGTRSSAELPAVAGGSGSCPPALAAHLSRARAAASIER